MTPLRRALAWMFTVALGLSPALLMSSASGGSAGFYVLVGLSIVVVAIGPLDPARPPLPLRGFRWAMYGMAVMLVAVLLSQAVHGVWKGSEVEKAARFAVLPLLLAAALRVPAPILRHALLGLLPGVWVAVANIGWLSWLSGGRPQTWQFNAVTYGDLTLLSSAICLLLLGEPITRFARTESALKLLTGIAGLVGFLLTQTRGGLLAIPVFLLIAVFAVGRARGRAALLAGLAMLAVVAAAALHDGSLRERIGDGVSEFDQCRSTHLADTSVCIRLQLWTAAGSMIRAQPAFGVGGNDRFREELHAMAQRKQVSQLVARDYGESHNDLLYFLAAYGALAGVGLLALYVAPGVVFARRMRQCWPRPSLLAGAGLVMCAGFVVFGFTEMMFRDMRVASFYATWMAAFLALAYARDENGQGAARLGTGGKDPPRHAGLRQDAPQDGAHG